MQNHVVEMPVAASSGFRCLLEGQTWAGNLCGESKKSSEKGFHYASRKFVWAQQDRGHDPNGSRDIDSPNPKRNEASPEEKLIKDYKPRYNDFTDDKQFLLFGWIYRMSCLSFGFAEIKRMMEPTTMDLLLSGYA